MELESKLAIIVSGNIATQSHLFKGDVITHFLSLLEVYLHRRVNVLFS